MEHAHKYRMHLQCKKRAQWEARKVEIPELMLGAKLPSESRADLLLHKDTKGRVHSNFPLNWKAG